MSELKSHINLVELNEHILRPSTSKESQISILRSNKIAISDETSSTADHDIQRALEFKRKFRSIYSDRRELAIIYEDETKRQRLCCSFISPTSGGRDGLHTYRQCADFVSSCCAYEKLDPPFDFPTQTFTPNYVLSQAKGNSLGLSILLASLLKGSGYDAYVACGYGSKQVSENVFLEDLYDLETDLKDFQDDAIVEKSVTVAVNNVSKYSAKPTRSELLESKKATTHTSQPVTNAKNPQTQATQEDDLYGLRVHYWVLVNPGLMEVVEPFFMEPTTGKVYHTNDPNYVGLEFVFNNENVWVNMQPCPNGLAGISFDIVDNSLWEFLLSPGELLLSSPVNRVDLSLVSSKRHRLFEYKNAKIEYLCGQPDGLTKRVSLPNAILEWFSGRDDKLYKRFRGNDLVKEYFEKGKNYQKLIFRDKRLTLVDFRLETRFDCLKTFKRVNENKIKLFFDSREDGVSKRTIYLKDSSIETIQDLFTNAKLSDNPISKCVFDISHDQMKLFFAPDKTSLFPKSFSFQKVSGNKKTFVERSFVESFDPHRHMSPEPESLMLEVYDYLLIHEAKAVQLVKGIISEVKNINDTRIDEESKYFNKTQNPTNSDHPSKAEVVAEEQSVTTNKHNEELDYLSAFLVDVDREKLTQESVAKIRETCLSSMKERLLLQAQIIQTRYENEKSNLKQTEAELAAKINTISDVEKKRIEKDLESISFRIAVLEKRLERHKEVATEKYITLDTKLKQDPRLKVCSK